MVVDDSGDLGSQGGINMIDPGGDGFSVGSDADLEGNSHSVTLIRLGCGKAFSILRQDGGKGV